MSLGEVFGYIASVLVFATFYMKTMVPLRLVAIASNVAFIIYASVGGLTPILILHVMLLPLNVLRLLEIRAFGREVERAAQEGFSVQALLPLMQRRRIAPNQTLFAAGAPADALFYLAEGAVFLPELQREVGPGNFVGEFALFSESGRRTATAVARTDCTLFSLTRSAVFAALLQHPRLGIHLLRLITGRLLENTGQERMPPPVFQSAPATTRLPTRWSSPAARWGLGAAVLAGAAAILAISATYRPVYTMLNRDAVVTTWLNVVSAPIAGTVEGFDLKPGDKAGPSGRVGRIVNQSVDRSALIRVEGAAQQAAARLAELAVYEKRIAGLASEWQERKASYAEGFRRDLDLKIQEYTRRVALLQERVDFADATATRKHTLRLAGNASQADEEAAISSHRELLASLTDTQMDLERLRHRRSLAERGIYMQEDGKEPEWSWRSLDEIRLELARTERAAREGAAEVGTLQATLDNELRNLATAADAALVAPAGMTIWSTAASNGISVTRGQRLFTWIDCRKLLLDVPVTDTLALLVRDGERAEVTLDGEEVIRPAVVVMRRGATARLGKEELVSIAEWRQSSAQVIVALNDPGMLTGCPIGRRAFVSFPDQTLLGFLRAWLPVL